MNKKYSLIILFVVFQLLFFEDLAGQKWEFIKEKDGVRIYTRKEANTSLKSFRGEATLHTQMDKVCTLIGNVKNVDWWDKNLREITVLSYEENKNIRYYLIYGVPWPLTDRDLCVEAKITTDPVTGQRVIYSVPLDNVIPEKPGLIRIKKYWQKWTIQPMENGTIYAVLEGFVDPAGNVPAWLYNMVIVDTPLKIFRGIKNRLEAK